MKLRHALVPLGLAAAIAAATAGPTVAAPLHSAPATVANAMPQDVTSVRYRKRHHNRRHVRRHYRDNVGSIVRTPGAPYYAYNRWSGQYHRSCVIDLGYGRTQPCDAGGGSR
jgi:hypothetical protein